MYGSIEQVVKEIAKDEDIPPELISGLQEFANEPLFKSLTKDLSIKLRSIVIGNTTTKALNSKKELEFKNLNFAKRRVSLF